MRIPIIFDCDPGADDAVMLLMALAVPDSLDIQGITTVAGLFAHHREMSFQLINDNLPPFIQAM